MDYVSGTSDAALNSSSTSDVSLHQIQGQREDFSPSTERLGLKNKFCIIPQPRGPAVRPRVGDFVEMLTGGNSPPQHSRELLKDQRLQHRHCRPCSRAATFPSPSLQYFQPQQPPRRLLRTLGGGKQLWLCCGSALDQPPPPSRFSRHTSGIKDKL